MTTPNLAKQDYLRDIAANLLLLSLVAKLTLSKLHVAH